MLLCAPILQIANLFALKNVIGDLSGWAPQVQNMGDVNSRIGDFYAGISPEILSVGIESCAWLFEIQSK